MVSFRSVITPHVRVLLIAIAAAGLVRATSFAGKARKYLEDPAFQWKCDTLPNAEFCYPSEISRPLAASIATDVETIEGQELRWAGASTYGPRIHVFMVETAGRMRELTGVYANGSSEPADHVVCFVLGHTEALTHELNHEIMTGLWGPSEPWIAEGLAAYISAPKQVDQQARALTNLSRYIALHYLVNPSWTAAQYPSTTIYPELGSFVKYLIITYGTDRLRSVWKGGSASIPRVYGRSLAILERDWRASLQDH